ncbi:MAG: hypothetical protein ACI4E5_05830 [Suilimivivens sp.]
MKWAVLSEYLPADILSSPMTAFGILGNSCCKCLLAALLANLKPLACKDAMSLLKNFVKNQKIHFRKRTARFNCLSVSEFLNRTVYIVSKMDFLDFTKIFHRIKHFTRYGFFKHAIRAATFLQRLFLQIRRKAVKRN